MLWRLEAAPLPPPAPAQLAEDLALYLRHAPLAMALAQVAEAQRAYLAGGGCGGCRRGRCEPACPMQLLRRALLADRAALDLAPAPLGLARRPLARLALAIPGRAARPLDGRLLWPWREARLWLTWRRAGGRLVVGAALAVGADGPAPAAALRAEGWLALGLPGPAARSLAHGAPPPIPLGWPAPVPPFLPLPARAGGELPATPSAVDASGRYARQAAGAVPSAPAPHGRAAAPDPPREACGAQYPVPDARGAPESAIVAEGCQQPPIP